MTKQHRSGILEIDVPPENQEHLRQIVARAIHDACPIDAVSFLRDGIGIKIDQLDLFDPEWFGDLAATFPNGHVVLRWACHWVDGHGIDWRHAGRKISLHVPEQNHVGVSLVSGWDRANISPGGVENLILDYLIEHGVELVKTREFCSVLVGHYGHDEFEQSIDFASTPLADLKMPDDERQYIKMQCAGPGSVPIVILDDDDRFICFCMAELDEEVNNDSK